MLMNMSSHLVLLTFLFSENTLWHLLLFQDLIDWNKAILPQVGKLGADYLNWVHSPVDRPLRLFESDFVEFFSMTPWYMVPIIWIPTMLYVCFVACRDLTARNGIGNIDPDLLNSGPKVFSVFTFLFLIGIFVWSLIEYCLHRFLFHLINHVPADSPFWITIHFFLHGQHHKVGDTLEFVLFFNSFFYYKLQLLFCLIFIESKGNNFFKCLL